MIHKASMDPGARIIAESLPAEGDTIEVENFGMATVEKLTHSQFDNFIAVIWSGDVPENYRHRTYRFSVENQRAA